MAFQAAAEQAGKRGLDFGAGVATNDAAGLAATTDRHLRLDHPGHRPATAADTGHEHPRRNRNTCAAQQRLAVGLDQQHVRMSPVP